MFRCPCHIVTFETVVILAATVEELSRTPLDENLSGWQARMTTVSTFTFAHPCYHFTLATILLLLNTIWLITMTKPHEKPDRRWVASRLVTHKAKTWDQHRLKPVMLARFASFCKLCKLLQAFASFASFCKLCKLLQVFASFLQAFASFLQALQAFASFWKLFLSMMMDAYQIMNT